MSNVVSLRPDAPGREAPKSIEAEQGLLGALLMNNAAYSKIADIIAPEDFHEPLHAQVFAKLRDCIVAGRVANPITLCTYLGDADLGGMTVSQYIARLAAEATSVVLAPDYARTIVELATRRRILAMCEQTIARVYDPQVSDTVSAMIDGMQSEIESLRPASQSEASGVVSIGRAINQAMQAAARSFEADSGIIGLSTGFSNLDDALGGMAPSDMIVIGGRPGSGKTTLATNIAHHVARALAEARKQSGVDRGSVLFYSQEMSSPQLAGRLLSEMSGVPSWRIRRGRVSDGEFAAYEQAGHDMKNLPLYIDDAGGQTIATISVKARALMKRRGLDLIVIDYIQLMHGSGKRSSDNRTNELTEITGGLKSLAKELKIPVIALSQVSRQVDMREDRRPKLADLRESGSIEQDADIVMLLYREEHYLKQNRPDEGTEKFEEWERLMSAAAGRAECNIEKHRHGDTQRVIMGFDSARTAFLNNPPEHGDERSGGTRTPPSERKEKRKKVPAGATLLYGVLKAEILNHGIDPPSEMSKIVRMGAKLVAYDRAVSRWYFEAHGKPFEDMEEDENRAKELLKARSDFRDAFKFLRAADIAQFVKHPNDSRVFIYLPELCPKR